MLSDPAVKNTCMGMGQGIGMTTFQISRGCWTYKCSR